MQPRLEVLSPKLLIGQQAILSLANDKTKQLFREFMPRRKEIVQIKDQFIYDLRIYPENYFTSFKPAATFTKWALVEVTHLEQIPAGMQSFELQGGAYAVFTPSGPANDPGIYQYIFGQWLPASGFALDRRPHFERLDPKGKKENPAAEEEIWVPIKDQALLL